jgi:protein-disulfide isomerase
VKAALIATSVVLASSLVRAQEPVPAQAEATASAPASVEIFCDFRCPFCARMFNTLMPLAKAEHRALTFRFRNYDFHAGSQGQARFFEAARLQSQVNSVALIESLYRFQKNIGKNYTAGEHALATLHGIDEQQLARDFTSRDVLLTILRDEQDAVKLGVEDTPSVFIDGQKVGGEPEEIALAILRVSPVDTTAGSPPEPCPICSK